MPPPASSIPSASVNPGFVAIDRVQLSKVSKTTNIADRQYTASRAALVYIGRLDAPRHEEIVSIFRKRGAHGKVYLRGREAVLDAPRVNMWYGSGSITTTRKQYTAVWALAR